MAEPIIYTIPMDFYGGKNAPPAELGATHAAPIESQKVTPAPVATRQPMPAPRQPILPPKQTLVQPAPQTSSNKIIIIAAVIVVILMLIAGGVWYWNNSKTPAPQTLPAVTLATSTPEVVIETPTSTPTSTIEIPVVPTSTVALIPPHVFRDSADSDGDGLTDVEEEMLGTNPTLIDTDSDTYPDR